MGPQSPIALASAAKLVGGDDMPAVCVTAGSRAPRHGERAISSAARAALRMARRSPYCLRTVRGAVIALHSVTRAWTSAGMIALSGRSPSAGMRWTRTIDSSLASALGCVPGESSQRTAQSPNGTPPIRRIDVPAGELGVLDRGQPPLRIEPPSERPRPLPPCQRRVEPTRR